MTTTDKLFVIRPIRIEDEEAFNELVGIIGDGLTSLPKDEEFLKHRIHNSLRAFYPEIQKPGGEAYLFVLEDHDTGQVIGTSGILSKVGGFEPFYTYEIKREVTCYKQLDIENEIELLELKKSHSGPTELCSLFLHPDYRAYGLGRLLSFSRFLFIKAFRERFDDHLIAELRGFIDNDRGSPFWNAVGAKFFQKDYYTADIISGLGDKEFIEALMPKFPIYLSLLPQEAREVIGKVHPNTEAAKKILLDQGFEISPEVDIFDAGPLLKAETDQIKTVRNCQSLPVTINDTATLSESGFVSNLNLDFRCCRATYERQDDRLVLNTKTAQSLNLKEGDLAQYVSL